mmetsp:Transcript_30564/g.30011  ORF Transcript_30564/g.30011 Transcript_30564/m.30011 type:complete len:226 (+) Transcript_30564:1017-1694(+)
MAGGSLVVDPHRPLRVALQGVEDALDHAQGDLIKGHGPIEHGGVEDGVVEHELVVDVCDVGSSPAVALHVAVEDALVQEERGLEGDFLDGLLDEELDDGVVAEEPGVVDGEVPVLVRDVLLRLLLRQNRLHHVQVPIPRRPVQRRPERVLIVHIHIRPSRQKDQNHLQPRAGVLPHPIFILLADPPLLVQVQLLLLPPTPLEVVDAGQPQRSVPVGVPLLDPLQQ